jgi:RNA polymerase sigma factor (sigma-70 family)
MAETGKKRSASSAGTRDELDELLLDVQAFLRQPGRGPRAPKALKARWERFRLVARPLIRGTLAQKGIYEPDLDDLTQDTWVVLFGKLPDFYPSGPGCVSAWIGRIAHRLAMHHWGRPGSQSAPTIVSASFDSLAAREPDPAVTVERRDELDRVHDVMTQFWRTLPRENRMILRAYVLSGRSAKEVADKIGISEVSVRDRARRIREALAAKLRLAGVLDDRQRN